MATPETARESSAGAKPHGGFRTDIEGLRGVAVTAVVLFHAGVAGFDGGFVGVDVFFVISGFLITGLLVREVDQRGSVHLLEFWARRARRLIPGLAVVMVATLLGILLVYSPLQWKAMGTDVQSSAVYASNLMFARQSVGYFETPLIVSPVLHTWSLAVEEQFYLAWPLLFLVMGKLGWTRERLARRATLVLVPSALCSFGLSLVLSTRGTPWAFYSSPTRAWEFAIGALGAVYVSRATRSAGSGLAAVLGAVGLSLIVVATLLFDGLLPYPGVAAAVPVTGTALLLIAGAVSPNGPTARVLSLAPIRWVGSISYAWYLWHWPAIILTAAAFPAISVLGKVGAATVALGLAWLSTTLVEAPIRFSPSLTPSRVRTFTVAAGATLVVLVLAMGLRTIATFALDDPYLRQLASIQAERTSAYGCAVTPGGSPDVCVLGDVGAPTTLLLLGDSHALHLQPTFDMAGRSLHIRVVIRAVGGCPAPEIVIAVEGTRRPSSECRTFHAETTEVIASERPDAIVVSDSFYPGRVLAADGSSLSPEEEATAWTNALGDLLRRLGAGANPVGVVLQSPQFVTEPVECAAKHGSGATCGIARTDLTAIIGPENDRIRAAIQSSGSVEVLDPLAIMCDDVMCPVEADGVFRYSDTNHLSHAYATSIAPAFEPMLCRLLERKASGCPR